MRSSLWRLVAQGAFLLLLVLAGMGSGRDARAASAAAPLPDPADPGATCSVWSS